MTEAAADTELDKEYINAKASLAALEKMRERGYPILDQTIRWASDRVREVRVRLEGR